jgi:hypothetical protein
VRRRTRLTVAVIDDDARADAWPDAAPEELVSAGPWRFRLRGTEMADVTYDGTPVLRAVRFVTRDHDWRTAKDTLVTRTVDQTSTGVGVRIAARSGFDGEDVLEYTLAVRIEGDVLRVDGSATTLRPFRRNRVGLVALHPAALAGVPLVVEHPDGRPSVTTYPLWIAPHQPAVDVVGYRWTAGSTTVGMTLTGDVFEMEDQRNWSDASFKTYSTPLAEPFPVALEPGASVRQALTLRCAHVRTGGTVTVLSDVPPVDGPAAEPVAGPAPVLQLLASSAPAALRPADDDLRPGVPVLVEPVVGAPNVAAVLASARRDAVHAPLDVRFVTDDPVALRAAIDDVLGSGAVLRVGAFDPRTHLTTPALQQALRDAARADGGLEVVAGTRAHFTELNRAVERFADWDGPLTFSVTPQMHDRSRAQVTEAVRMLRWVAMSASRLAAGRPLHVGPVTLRPRFNAVATSAPVPVTRADLEDGHGPQFVPDATDPEQHSPAADAWFRRAVHALRAPGLVSITLDEAWGPRGSTGRSLSA